MKRKSCVEIFNTLFEKTDTDSANNYELTKALSLYSIAASLATLADAMTSKENKIGHWMLKQRDKDIDICCPFCGITRVKDYAYNYLVEQLDKEDLKRFYKDNNMHFCENCGARMEID